MKCYVLIDDQVLALTREEVYDPSVFNTVKKLYLHNQCYMNRYYKDDYIRLDDMIKRLNTLTTVLQYREFEINPSCGKVNLKLI